MLRAALGFACVPIAMCAGTWLATRAACAAAPTPASTGDVVNFLAPQALFGALGEALAIAFGTGVAALVALTPLRGPLPGWAAQAIVWLPAATVLLSGSRVATVAGAPVAVPLVTSWAVVTVVVAALSGLGAGRLSLPGWVVAAPPALFVATAGGLWLREHAEGRALWAAAKARTEARIERHQRASEVIATGDGPAAVTAASQDADFRAVLWQLVAREVSVGFAAEDRAALAALAALDCLAPDPAQACAAWARLEAAEGNAAEIAVRIGDAARSGLPVEQLALAYADRVMPSGGYASAGEPRDALLDALSTVFRAACAQGDPAPSSPLDARLHAFARASMEATDAGALARHLARVDVCDRARAEGLHVLHRDIQRLAGVPCPGEGVGEACEHAAWRALLPGDRAALEDALVRWADRPGTADAVRITRAALRDAAAR